MTGRKIFLRKIVPLFIFLSLVCAVARESYALMTAEEEKKLGKTILLEMQKRVDRVKDPSRRPLRSLGILLRS